MPRTKINVYTDGWLKNPSCTVLAVGGCGILVPQEAGEDLAALGSATTKFVHRGRWNEGTAMWSPLLGLWQTAARAELAALVMAMHIRIGIDNKAVVDRAGMLIEIAREIEMLP